MTSQAAEPLDHGGDLAAARRLFPRAPEPFLDLSTGINPYPYQPPALPAALFERLPDTGALDRLMAAAAAAYGAPSPACVVAAPGTQILLPLVTALAPPGRAAILSPTYAEHARAAALAGHDVFETHELAHLAESDLAVVVNPNNPDGRIVAKADLLALAEAEAGLLVVDEAFMDVGRPEQMTRNARAAPQTPSLPGLTRQSPSPSLPRKRGREPSQRARPQAGPMTGSARREGAMDTRVKPAYDESLTVCLSLSSEVLRGNIVVLRSFGKFFGLAGLRLGFAIAAPDIAARLRAALGPWAVSGPAIAIGTAALSDHAWIAATREKLAQAAQRLDELLARADLEVVGGTSLFRLVQTPDAAAVFEQLGRAGILVRRFNAQPTWLRFGLPGSEEAWDRLARALATRSSSPRL